MIANTLDSFDTKKTCFIYLGLLLCAPLSAIGCASTDPGSSRFNFESDVDGGTSDLDAARSNPDEQATDETQETDEQATDETQETDEQATDETQETEDASVPDASQPDAMLPARCQERFDDVPPGHRAYSEAHALYFNEVTNGCADNPLRYCPLTDLTRSQASVMMLKAAGYSPSGVAYNAYFNDIPNTAAAGYINRMKELGITNGCGDGSGFCPNESIPRRNFAVFLIRAMGESPSNVATNAYFDDITDLYDGYINRLSELGVTGGCAARMFCPTTPLSRSQAAVMLVRAFAIPQDTCGSL